MTDTQNKIKKPSCAKKYDVEFNFPEFLTKKEKIAFEKIDLIKFMTSCLFFSEKENQTKGKQNHD